MTAGRARTPRARPAPVPGRPPVGPRAGAGGAVAPPGIVTISGSGGVVTHSPVTGSGVRSPRGYGPGSAAGPPPPGRSAGMQPMSCTASGRPSWSNRYTPDSGLPCASNGRTSVTGSPSRSRPGCTQDAWPPSHGGDASECTAPSSTPAANAFSGTTAHSSRRSARVRAPSANDSGIATSPSTAPVTNAVGPCPAKR